MILQTKYFDLETDMFSFKNPESIRQQLEEKYYRYFTDEPCNETIIYNDQFKIHLKYKRINDFLSINPEFPTEELLFPDVGCIEGYKITNSDYSCRGFKYELNHTYSMKEDPIPCSKSFHFCKELADCFNYYHPEKSLLGVWNLDTYRFLKVRSNGITYQISDKYCTNNITILEECTTEEILTALYKWMHKYELIDQRVKLYELIDQRVKLRDEYYDYHYGYFRKVIPELPDNQPTWAFYIPEEN